MFVAGASAAVVLTRVSLAAQDVDEQHDGIVQHLEVVLRPAVARVRRGRPVDGQVGRLGMTGYGGVASDNGRRQLDCGCEGRLGRR